MTTASQKLSRGDLMPLEVYAEKRQAFRAEVMAHKKDRQVQIGDHATLYFEDRLTMQYQVQEMLRTERIFEPAGIEEELDAYNPLIPDGTNWKATFMIEYEDAAERARELARLIGIEDQTWVQVEGHDKVFAVADEDLDRDTDEKTSSVHFMRFELTDDMREAVKAGAGIAMGIDHVNYSYRVDVAASVRASLAADID